MAHILVTIRFHEAGWRCGPAGSSSASRPPTSSLIAPVWPFRRPLRHWCQGLQACFPWAPARTEFPLSPVGRTPPWPGCPHRSRHLCFLAGAGAHRRELRAQRVDASCRGWTRENRGNCDGSDLSWPQEADPTTGGSSLEAWVGGALRRARSPE